MNPTRTTKSSVSRFDKLWYRYVHNPTKKIRTFYKVGVFLTAGALALFIWQSSRHNPATQQATPQQRAAHLLYRADLWVDKGDKKRAGDLIESAVGVAPKWPDVWVKRGFLKLSEGKANNALMDFEQAGRLGSKVDMEAGLAEVYLSLQLPRNAEKHARRALAIKGALVSVRLCLVQALLAQGRNAEAALEIRKALQLQNDNPMAWTLKGDVALRLGQPALARTAYETALKFAPGASGALMGVGEAFLEQGQPDRARRWYLDHLKPGNAGPVFNNLALVYLVKPFNPKTANKLAYSAVRQNPISPAYKDTLGRTLLAQGKYREAEVWLRQAMDGAPAHPAPRYFLAAALAMGKDFDHAAALLDEGLNGSVVLHGPTSKKSYQSLLRAVHAKRDRFQLNWGLAG